MVSYVKYSKFISFKRAKYAKFLQKHCKIRLAFKPAFLYD